MASLVLCAMVGGISATSSCLFLRACDKGSNWIFLCWNVYPMRRRSSFGGTWYAVRICHRSWRMLKNVMHLNCDVQVPQDRQIARLAIAPGSQHENGVSAHHPARPLVSGGPAAETGRKRRLSEEMRACPGGGVAGSANRRGGPGLGAGA